LTQIAISSVCVGVT